MFSGDLKELGFQGRRCLSTEVLGHPNMVFVGVLIFS